MRVFSFWDKMGGTVGMNKVFYEDKQKNTATSVIHTGESHAYQARIETEKKDKNKLDWMIMYTVRSVKQNSEETGDGSRPVVTLYILLTFFCIVFICSFVDSMLSRFATTITAYTHDTQYMQPMEMVSVFETKCQSLCHWFVRLKFRIYMFGCNSIGYNAKIV